MNKFEITDYPIIFDKPKRVANPLSWIEHIPFAFLIVSLLKPKLIVELGVYSGNSYNAFCQAAEKLRLKTKCYGIDNWTGDQHVGNYSPMVFEDLKKYQDDNYLDFSTLIKSEFDNAIDLFDDKSIDLLHIDGCHKYEDVKHDYESWLPKISNNGVILLHDTSERRDDYGVWKLWNEIRNLSPSYEFIFGHGLGIIYLKQNNNPILLNFIKEVNDNNYIPNLFSILGEKLLNESQERIESDLHNLYQTLFIDTGDGFNESQKIVKTFEINYENRFAITYNLAQLNDIQNLRFDPCDEQCRIKIKNAIAIFPDNSKVKLGFTSNASKLDVGILNFTTQDPQINFHSVDFENIQELLIELEYISIGGDNNIFTLQKHREEIEHSKKRIQNLETIVESTNKELGKSIAQKNFLIQQHELAINKNNKLLRDKENEIENHQKEHNNKNLQISKLKDDIANQLSAVQKKEYEIQVLEDELKLKTNLFTRLENKNKKNIATISKDKEYILQKESEIGDKNKSLSEYKTVLEQKEKLIKGKLSLIKKQGGIIEGFQSELIKKEIRIETHLEQIKQLKGTIKSKTDHVDALEINIQSNLIDISNLKKSLSFKIGWFITAPARYFYNLIKNKTNTDNERHLWLQIMTLGIKHPIRLIKQLNLHNLKTLNNALKREDKLTIFANYKKLLTKNDTKNTVDENQITKLHGNQANYSPEQEPIHKINLIKNSNLFDEKYYLDQYPDVKQAGMDAAEHYFYQGWKEGRNPGLIFNTNNYFSKNPDVEKAHINPLVHYLEAGKIEGRSIAPMHPNKPAVNYLTLDDLHNPYLNANAHPKYEDEEFPNLSGLTIKPIAFYLPQFHPFEENDNFWGKGFTEWTNTTKALPLFEGHYQPRLPGELGFYDLRLKETMKRQIELARQYGIYGFCFHHYFFDGKPLMHLPFDQFLKNKDFDIPFCLHWANEPWTAKFDGGIEKGEILLNQRHSPDDDIAFFENIEPALRDSRYININGRPLLLIYRPGLFPNFKKTVERWKKCCKKAGLEELYLVNVETGFEKIKPPSFWSCEAAVEFPPHQSKIVDYHNEIYLFDRNFKGKIYDYDEVVKVSIKKKPPNYKLFRGIFPDWDNTARRKESTIFFGASPQKYQAWLEGLCRYTENEFPEDERFIFINAWNEWAEGAYLEPDRKYGYANLNATARALSKFTKAKTGNGKILFVSHDAHHAGAQIIFHNILKWFKNYTNLEIKILCIDGGELLDKFKQIGDTLVFRTLEEKINDNGLIVARLFEFCKGKPDLIYANSVASGKAFSVLNKMGIPILTHVHELQKSIEVYASDYMIDIIKHTNHFIACSGAVAENLITNFKVPKSKIDLIYEFIDARPNHIPTYESKIAKRVLLGIETDKIIVFGSGFGLFWRKGADLFIKTAKNLLELGFKDFHFYWLGSFDENNSDKKYGTWKDNFIKIDEYGLSDHVTFLGRKENVQDYYEAGDIFILPSREDPFPLVCLEAASCGLPIICFSDAGGMPDFVEKDAGFIVQFEDTKSMAKRIQKLSKDQVLLKKLGTHAQQKVLAKYTLDIAIPEILSVCHKIGNIKPLVSIIVPNYNYEQFLEKRLESIFNQTFKDFEVIILDDASTDKSIEIISKYLIRPEVTLITNKKNSASAFKQWIKGLELAKGEIIWIAEADDYSEGNFLEKLLPNFSDKEVNLVYSQSEIIGENDEKYGYHKYFEILSETKWKKQFKNTIHEEINEGLGIMNTIPNVSAVLIRNNGLSQIDELKDFKVMGDWFFYLNAAKGGKIVFDPDALNFHRRHQKSIISENEKSPVYFEELARVHSYIIENFILDLSLPGKMINHAIFEWNRLIGKNINKLSEVYPHNRLSALVNKNENAFPHNVLIVLSDLGIGGGQVVAIRLANGLRLLGFSVCVLNVGAHPTNDEIRNMISSNIDVINVSDWNDKDKEFKKLIRDRKISIINSHIWWSDKFVIQHIKKTNIPWIITMHGCYEFLIEKPENDIQFHELLPEIILRANKFIYLTDKNLKVFTQYKIQDQKKKKIYNGYHPVFSKPIKKSDLGIEKNAFIVGIASRAIPEKGWEIAIQSIIDIRKTEQTPVYLILVGESDYSKQLFKKYGHHSFLKFVGFSNTPMEWIQLFDIVLLPTYFVSESLPNTIIEGLAAGKPIVASAMGEIPEMIKHNDLSAGFILEKTINRKPDFNEISARIKQYINNKILYEEHSMISKLAFKKFSLKRFVNDYIDQFDSVQK